MKKRVRIGEVFDFEVIEENTDTIESTIRGRLALRVSGVVAVFLIGASVIGCMDGSFNELLVVWSVCGPIIGGVVAYYFGGLGIMKGGFVERNDQQSPPEAG